MRDKLKGNRRLRREIFYLLKDLYYFSFFIFSLILNFFTLKVETKDTNQIQCDLIVRLDGLGDVVNSLSWIKHHLSMTNNNILLMVSSSWLDVLVKLIDDDLFNCRHRINLIGFSRDNLCISWRKIYKLERIQNVFIINFTPDINELFIWRIYRKMNPLLVYSASNVSSLTELFFRRTYSCEIVFENSSDEVESLYYRFGGVESLAVLDNIKSDPFRVAVCLNSSDPRKDPDPNFVFSLIETLFKNKIVEVVIIGKTSAIDSIPYKFPFRVTDMRNKQTLFEAVTELQSCSHYIGADTAFAHFSSVFGLHLYVFIGLMHGSWYYPHRYYISQIINVFQSECVHEYCNFDCRYSVSGDSKFRCLRETECNHATL